MDGIKINSRLPRQLSREKEPTESVVGLQDGNRQDGTDELAGMKLKKKGK